MQGKKQYQEKLFTNFHLSERIPSENFYPTFGARCAVNRVPIDMKVQECCIKDDSRSITVAVQAEAVNRLSVLV